MRIDIIYKFYSHFPLPLPRLLAAIDFIQGSVFYLSRKINSCIAVLFYRKCTVDSKSRVFLKWMVSYGVNVNKKYLIQMYPKQSTVI